MLAFSVESYAVLTGQAGLTHAAAWRTMELRGPALGQGPQLRASLYFFATISSQGVVTNVDQSNDLGPNVNAYLPLSEFTAWSALLTGPAATVFSCEYSGPDYDPLRRIRDVRRVQLLTRTVTTAGTHIVAESTQTATPSPQTPGPQTPAAQTSPPNAVRPGAADHPRASSDTVPLPPPPRPSQD